MLEPHPPPDPEKAKAHSPDSLAAEGLGLSEALTLGQRLRRYGTGKGRSYTMAGHLVRVSESAADDRIAQRLYQCAGLLRFRHWLAHGRTTLSGGYFCQLHLLCPFCALRRGAKLLRKYAEKAEVVAPGVDLWLVTLTVRNGHDLADRFQHLRRSHKRLWERARKGYGALAPSVGAVWSFELTKSGAGWHPHVHAIVAMPKGAPLRWGEGSQLREDWHAVTGDSFIVHAAPIARGGEVDGLLEVLKYALKFADLPLDDNLAAWRLLRGKHLVQSSGVWRGVQEPDDLAEDPLDGPFVDLVFRWAGARGYVPHDQDTWDRTDEALARTDVDSPHGSIRSTHGGQDQRGPDVLGQGQPHPRAAREAA